MLVWPLSLSSDVSGPCTMNKPGRGGYHTLIAATRESSPRPSGELSSEPRATVQHRCRHAGCSASKLQYCVESPTPCLACCLSTTSKRELRGVMHVFKGVLWVVCVCCCMPMILICPNQHMSQSAQGRSGLRRSSQARGICVIRGQSGRRAPP